MKCLKFNKCSKMKFPKIYCFYPEVHDQDRHDVLKNRKTSDCFSFAGSFSSVDFCTQKQTGLELKVQ